MAGESVTLNDCLSLHFTYLWSSYFLSSIDQSLIGKYNQADVFSPSKDLLLDLAMI